MELSIGPDFPVVVIAEIGVNHEGNVDKAIELIDIAIDAGADAVKFQVRTPSECVPEDYKDIVRTTPWGETVSYLEWRELMEMPLAHMYHLLQYCHTEGIAPIVSAWDVESLDRMLEANPAPTMFKVPSACITDRSLLRRLNRLKRPVLVSTGMSSVAHIDKAVHELSDCGVILMQCTSTYPTPPEEVNLRAISSLAYRYQIPVGYSGHEIGYWPTVAALGYGASVVERHIRADDYTGSDAEVSLCKSDFENMVTIIKHVDRCKGDGSKTIYQSELPAMKKLRKYK